MENGIAIDIIEEPTSSTKFIKRRGDCANKSIKKFRGEEFSTVEGDAPSIFDRASSNTDLLSSVVIKGANRLLFDNGLFEVVQKRDETPYLKQSGGIVAQCRTCLTKIKGSLNVSSNFISHLRNKHPEDYIKYEKQKKEKQEVYELETSVACNKNVIYVINEVENAKATTDFEPYDVAEEATYSSDFLKIEEDTRSVDKRFEPSNGVSPEKFGSQDESDASTSIDLSSSEIKGANRLLFDNAFFEVLQKRDETPHLKKMGGIVAQCLHCTTKIKGSLGVSSNFISHLRQQHPPEYSKYEKLKKGRLKPEYLRNKEQRKTQEKQKMTVSFNDRMLNFLASTYTPLSMIDHPAFINLFEGTHLKLNSSHVMSDHLREKHCKWVCAIRKTLDEVPYCCTTVHIWPAGQVTFLGYSCHWIERNTFQRKTTALACRQFNRRHENILKIINNIHTEFGLSNNKILLTITDNESDVCKTQREYSAAEQVEGMNIEIEVDSNAVDMAEYNDILGLHELPKHFQSASRTLNLLATMDLQHIIEKNEKHLSQHQQSFARCFEVWDKCCLPESAQITENLLCCALKTPPAKCWNSLFDSIKHLLLYKDKLPALCTDLNVSEFTPSDIEYLQSYITLMSPVASALDFLHSNDNMYFGHFIATIVSLKVKLIRIETLGELNDWRHVCGELINCLLERFETYFHIDAEAEDAIVAAISCPNIKLRFVPVLLQTAPEMTMENIKEMFIRHAKAVFSSKVKTEVFTNNSDDGFLDFGDEDESVYRELEMYLADSDTSFQCFQHYPIVRQVFIKYNTPIPAFAASVERLFPFADIMNIPWRKNHSNASFEQLLLMRANHL